MTLFETEFFRMLLHLCCLSGCEEDSLQDISVLCRVGSDNIEQYLLDQINANIAKCARLANLSQDSIMVLLADFMVKIPVYEITQKFNLMNQAGRSDWERAFVDQLRINVGKLDETNKTLKEA